MDDQSVPSPEHPARAAAVPRTVPVERGERLGANAPDALAQDPDGVRVKFFDREIFGWIVFAIILAVAAAAAWGTFIVLRQ